MVDDPMMIWSPSFSSVLRMRAPLTNVPFRDARSSIMTLPPWVEIFGVFAGHFFVEQQHIDVADATDDDVQVLRQGEFPSLVLAGDETEYVLQHSFLRCPVSRLSAAKLYRGAGSRSSHSARPQLLAAPAQGQQGQNCCSNRAKPKP